MRILLDARQKLGFQWEDPSRANNVEVVMRYHTVKKRESKFRFTTVDLLRGISHEVFVEVAPIIRDLWDDKSIRKTYDQRNLFQIVGLLYHGKDGI